MGERSCARGDSLDLDHQRRHSAYRRGKSMSTPSVEKAAWAAVSLLWSTATILSRPGSCSRSANRLTTAASDEASTTAPSTSSTRPEDLGHRSKEWARCQRRTGLKDRLKRGERRVELDVAPVLLRAGRLLQGFEDLMGGGHLLPPPIWGGSSQPGEGFGVERGQRVSGWKPSRSYFTYGDSANHSAGPSASVVTSDEACHSIHPRPYCSAESICART